MKISLLAFLSLASLGALQAQPGRMGMGGPPGPGLSGSTAKLFGDNTSFSANLEMQADSGQGTMTMPGKMIFDQGKSRFEMDMSQIKGGMMSPQAAVQMKSIGMDKTVVISRPDKKVSYQIYPGMQAYVETALPDQEATAPASDFKVDVTELGKETVEGHECVKNKAVVTDKDGTKHESFVWNATDLKKFPIKIEQTQDGHKTTMLFSAVSLSKPAASLFDPPSDATKYESMQSMMQQVMMKRFGGGAGRPPGQ
jgi:hypothetical protein